VLDPMDCLRDGVPPLLLIDLFGEAGPDAVHIYEDEPADVSWTHPAEHEVEGQLVIEEPPKPPKLPGSLPLRARVPLARTASVRSDGTTPVG
jgi:hypothetical protein